MKIEVQKSEIGGRVTVPMSKSYAQRALIMSYLSESDTTLICNQFSDDVTAMLALSSVFKKDYEIDLSDNLYIVQNSAKGGLSDQNKQLNICFGENGTMLRLAMSVLSALGVKAYLSAKGRLADRTIEPLLRTFEENGAEFSARKLPFVLGGQLIAGEYVIPGNISSQFVSGLLIALPLLDGDSTICLSTELLSQNYVDMTLSVMSDFGVRVQRTDKGFFVKGNQKYVLDQKFCGTYSVEADWSQACFFMALGVLCGKIEIADMNIESLQGDKVFFDILSHAGAKIEYTTDNSVLTDRSTSLSPIHCDINNCIDTAPILSVVMACTGGVSSMSGISRLSDKESDRLLAIINMLEDAKVKTEVKGDTLFVYGNTDKIDDICFRTCLDHRIAMSQIVLSIAKGAKTTISKAECMNKSYPNFACDIKSLGAKLMIDPEK